MRMKRMLRTPMQLLRWLPVLLLLCVSGPACPAAAEDFPFHGNRNSLIYHNSSCRYFWCKACTVKFRTAKEALARGFRPCKICRG